jgi:hypothetical protein
MGRIEGSRVDASSIPAGSKSTNNLWSKLTRRRAADAKRRRALELLADSADGCTEAIMVAHGFTVDMLVELINAGLATARAERTVAGRHPMEVPACGSRRRAGRRSPHEARNAGEQHNLDASRSMAKPSSKRRKRHSRPKNASLCPNMWPLVMPFVQRRHG